LPAFVSHQVTAARRFYLNLKPRASRTLTVVCGGYEECAPDYRVSRRTFPYLCVEFVAAGRGDVTLGGRTHALEPGSLFTYGPGVAHTIRTAPDAPLAKYFVDFVGRPGPARLRECGPGLGGVTQVPAIGEVREAFETLVRLGAVRDRRTAVTCGLQLDLLLHTVARARRPSAPAERRARATFERCREHLDTHFLALGSVAALAAACHVDASHLCRLFRRFRGEPPLRYLQSRRMHWAAERLHTSGALVREVADELGIDPFQFSRAFKRVHGLSPTAFLGMRAGH
jgi:AraC-like DNA-binding protein